MGEGGGRGGVVNGRTHPTPAASFAAVRDVMMENLSPAKENRYVMLELLMTMTLI